ncbi:MAG: hypothetical protein N2447_09890, partial [Thermoanaerobaculum sp.]|nr:hypothetical protein [Thermoanaerobaculum sp.]
MIKFLCQIEPRKFKPIRISDKQLHSLSRNQELLRNLLKVMYYNLWGQFGFTENKLKELAASDGEKPCVTDFAWTPEARDAFYSHKYHRKLWDYLTNSDNCYLKSTYASWL